MSIAEEIILRVENFVGPAAKAAASLSKISEGMQVLASKVSGLSAVTDQVEGLGSALSSLGPAGQMGGAIVTMIGQIGGAAVGAVSKIMGAGSKLINGLTGGSGGGGDKSSGGGDKGGDSGGGGVMDAAAPELAAALKIADFVKSSIMALVSAYMEVVSAVVTASMAFLKAGMEVSIEAATFKTEAVEALSKLEKSEANGLAMYDRLGKLSRDLGSTREQTLKEFKRLKSAGFGDNKSVKIIEEMKNMDAGRGAGSGQKLDRLLERIKTTGKLDMGGVKMAAKQLGIGTDDLIQELATKMHKSVAQVKSELKKGVGSSVGIDAILSQVDKKFGGLAKKAANSVPGLIMAIKDQITHLFEDVDLGPLKNTLKGIKDVLDSQLGKDLKGAMTELFSAVFSAIFGETAKGGDAIKNVVKGLTAFIKGLAADVKAIAPLVQAFVRGLMAALSALGSGAGKGGALDSLKEQLPVLIPKFEKLGGAIVKVGQILFSIGGTVIDVFGFLLDHMDTIITVLKVIGVVALVMAAPFIIAGVVIGAAIAVIIAILYVLFSVVSALVDMFVSAGEFIGESFVTAGAAISDAASSIGDAISDAFSSVSDTISNAIDAVSNFASDFVQAGSDLVAGMVEGITSNAGAIVEAVINACGNAIKAAEHILGIGSPSRVFAAIGGFTAQGMAGGITGGTSHVTSAVNRMGAAAAAAAAGHGLNIPAGANAGKGKGGAEAANGNGGGGITIQVTVQSRPGEPAQETGEKIATAVAKAMAVYMRKRAAGG